MALTPLTSATAYGITYSDMVVFHDARKIQDLVKDDGTRETALSTNTYITRALKRAAGEFEAACLRGGRYTPSDIAAMLTNGGAGAEMIIGIICDLAYWHLVKRRHGLSQRAKDTSGVGEAMELLAALSSGEAILSFQEAADAGLPQTEIETPQVKDDRGGIATVAARYYGRVNRRRPIGPADGWWG